MLLIDLINRASRGSWQASFFCVLAAGVVPGGKRIESAKSEEVDYWSTREGE